MKDTLISVGLLAAGGAAIAAASGVYSKGSRAMSGGKIESPTCPNCGVLARRIIKVRHVWEPILVKANGEWMPHDEPKVGREVEPIQIGSDIELSCGGGHRWKTRLV